MFGARARSASDAAVLRRKGHLKEQDALIDFLLQMHSTHTRWVLHLLTHNPCLKEQDALINFLLQMHSMHTRRALQIIGFMEVWVSSPI